MNRLQVDILPGLKALEHLRLYDFLRFRNPWRPEQLL